MSYFPPSASECSPAEPRTLWEEVFHSIINDVCLWKQGAQYLELPLVSHFLQGVHPSSCQERQLDVHRRPVVLLLRSGKYLGSDHFKVQTWWRCPDLSGKKWAIQVSHLMWTTSGSPGGKGKYIYQRGNCSCYHVFDPVDQQLEHTTNIATRRHGDDAKVVLFTNPD